MEISPRKRRRNYMVPSSSSNAVLMLSMMAAYCSVPRSDAFVHPTSSRVNLHPISSTQQQAKGAAMPLFQAPTSAAAPSSASSPSSSPKSHPGEEDGDRKTSRWLLFFNKSQKKGVSDVKMREAEELGGVPRSDRYSSR